LFDLDVEKSKAFHCPGRKMLLIGVQVRPGTLLCCAFIIFFDMKIKTSLIEKVSALFCG
jgi:hypothetical protein